MPIIPSIKSVLQPLFEAESGLNKVFVLCNKVVCSVTRERVATIDNDCYYVDHDVVLDIPIIALKVQK